MDRALTRGHPQALAAIEALIAAGGPHAVLLSGPFGVGKTTLALDLAAALLCTAGVGRPCRDCRGCRMVASGNHPDLHRLAPDGPGGQIRIGARSDPEAGTVRRLIADLSLLPVEGGARVAIVEQGHRLNDDAQSALLKTLEEPPAGVTIVLCADDEERLLPTIRSRCVRIRLGPVALRDLEFVLTDRGAADAPTAARLGRLAGGRPGVAMAWAAAPEAILARDAIARMILDLVPASRADRLAAARELLAQATAVAAALEAGSPPGPDGSGTRGQARGRSARRPSVAAAAAPSSASEGDTAAGESGPRRAPVAERRRAVGVVIEIWREVARDLGLVGMGGTGLVRDVALLDDLVASGAAFPRATAAAFLARLARAGELLEANVGPELVLDGLLLAWPRSSGGDAAARPSPATAAVGSR